MPKKPQVYKYPEGTIATNMWINSATFNCWERAGIIRATVRTKNGVYYALHYDPNLNNPKTDEFEVKARDNTVRLIIKDFNDPDKLVEIMRDVINDMSTSLPRYDINGFRKLIRKDHYRPEAFIYANIAGKIGDPPNNIMVGMVNLIEVALDRVDVRWTNSLNTMVDNCSKTYGVDIDTDVVDVCDVSDAIAAMKNRGFSRSEVNGAINCVFGCVTKRIFTRKYGGNLLTTERQVVYEPFRPGGYYVYANDILSPFDDGPPYPDEPF